MDYYADYLREREGKILLTRGYGFAVIKEHGNGVMEICEMYVDPELRKHGKATIMANDISAIALAADCHTLACACVPSTSGATDSLKAILSYGFELYSAEPDRIWLRKEIGFKKEAK